MRWLAVLFVVASFSSAALLFVLEPLVARMALPVLGGSPSVWTVAVVFYELALLLGYGYSHWLSRASLPLQAAIHLAFLAAAWLTLPIAVPGWVSSSLPGGPVGELLALLASSVGLPFVVLSSTSPLLQAWFARTAAGANPYRLYVASNGGSLLGLLAYPFALEPLLGLRDQSGLWRLAYLVLVALVATCVVGVARSQSGRLARTLDEADPPSGCTGRVTWRQRGLWVVLAALGSSWMLSATTALSTSIAPIPLIWVLPLALYLLTLMLAFSEQRRLRTWLTSGPLVRVSISVLAVGLMVGFHGPILPTLVIHLGVFFVAALVAHTRLAEAKPAPSALTEFYLWLAVGGAVGGLFNGLVASAFFNDVWEYPIDIVAFCALGLARPGLPAAWNARPRALGFDALWALGLVVLVAAPQYLVPADSGLALPLLVMCLLLGVCLALSQARRAPRYATALAALFSSAALLTAPFGQVIAQQRTFFGISRVVAEPSSGVHKLFHGQVEHGEQWLGTPEALTPTSYYTPDGPLGDVVLGGGADIHSIGVVGLGAGATACYRAADRSVTFFEIDPTVVRLASDPQLFTYLSACPPTQVVLGDARLTLAQTSQRFDVLVLDAYSGDSVPVQLLTREALALFAAHLNSGGALAFHISNRAFDLAPELGALCHAEGWACALREDTVRSQPPPGWTPSRWVAAAPDGSLRGPAAGADWVPLHGDGHTLAWTDDRSSLLPFVNPAALLGGG